MKEVTVYEDNHPRPNKDQVRFPGERGRVLPISKATSVGKRADLELRTRVLAAHPRHRVAALLRRKVVSHCSPREVAVAPGVGN